MILLGQTGSLKSLQAGCELDILSKSGISAAIWDSFEIVVISEGGIGAQGLSGWISNISLKLLSALKL